MVTCTTTLVLFIAVVQLTRARLLIGCDPRGELWVGPVDDSESETVRRSTIALSEKGDNRGDNVTTTADSRQVALRGHRYGTMSYDLFSDNILVELLNRDGSFRGLTKIPACRPAAKYPNVAKIVPDAAVLERVIIVDDGNPYLVTCAGTGHECGWSAFTYFYSVIYFLFVAQYGKSKTSLTTRVELRALTGCTDILFPTDPVSPKTAEFAVLNCSRVVATVLEVPPGGDDGWTIRAGKHMTVEPIDNTLHFFFQISRTKMSASKDVDLHDYREYKHTVEEEDEFTANGVSDWADAKKDGWDRLKMFTLDRDKPKTNKGNVADIARNKDVVHNRTRDNESDRGNRSESGEANIFTYIGSLGNITKKHGTIDNSVKSSSSVIAKYKHSKNNDSAVAEKKHSRKGNPIAKHGYSEDNSTAVTQNTNYATSGIVATDNGNSSENTSLSIIKNTVNDDTPHNASKPTDSFIQNQTYINSTAADTSRNTNIESTDAVTDTTITGTIDAIKYVNTTSNVDIINTTDYHVPSTENNSSMKHTSNNNTGTRERLYTVQTSLYRVTNVGRVDVLHIDVDRVSERTLPLRGYGGVSAQGRLLCWATFDRLYCANIASRIDIRQTLVESGEAARRGICFGTSVTDPYVISGVAMAADGWQLTIYFGCHFDDSAPGGAGVVETDLFIGRTKVMELTDTNGRVSADSLLQVAQVSVTCPIV